MKKLYLIISTVLLVTGVVYAGLTPAGTPDDTMVTLDDIYYRLQSTGTAASYGLNPPASPSVSMKTLQQIYDAAPNFNADPGTAVAGDVCNSATFYTNSTSPITGTRTNCSGSYNLADTGNTGCYNATTGITCGDASFPNQDGDYTTHELDYTAGTYTVVDNNTGLEWQRYGHGGSDGYTPPSWNCPSGVQYAGGYCWFTWEQGLNYCADLSLDSKTDWRLPNVKELFSIVRLDWTSPYIDDTIFLYNSGGDGYYQTSTTVASAPTKQWMVYFPYGEISTADFSKTSMPLVRCVRGGE